MHKTLIKWQKRQFLADFWGGIAQTLSIKNFLRTSSVQYGSKTCLDGSDLSIAPTPDPLGHVKYPKNVQKIHQPEITMVEKKVPICLRKCFPCQYYVCSITPRLSLKIIQCFKFFLGAMYHVWSTQVASKPDSTCFSYTSCFFSLQNVLRVPILAFFSNG